MGKKIGSGSYGKVYQAKHIPGHQEGLPGHGDPERSPLAPSLLPLITVIAEMVMGRGGEPGSVVHSASAKAGVRFPRISPRSHL